jgi:hypothetical protein
MHVLERADRRTNHNWQCQSVRESGSTLFISASFPSVTIKSARPDVEACCGIFAEVIGILLMSYEMT